MFDERPHVKCIGKIDQYYYQLFSFMSAILGLTISLRGDELHDVLLSSFLSLVAALLFYHWLKYKSRYVVYVDVDKRELFLLDTSFKIDNLSMDNKWLLDKSGKKLISQFDSGRKIWQAINETLREHRVEQKAKSDKETR